MKALTSLIFIAVSVALFFWYIEPAWATVNQTQAQISQYQGDIVSAAQAESKNNQLTSEYNAFSQDQLQQIQNFLPAHIDPIKFVMSLNTIAAQYSSGLDNISIGTAGAPSSNADTSSSYGILPVSFSVSMTYDNFLLFLRDLERSLPPVTITSLSFSSPTTGDVYTFSLSVQTYYLQ